MISIFNKNPKNTNKGFSLMEMIVYISLFTVISVSVISAIITVMSSFRNTQDTREMLDAGNTAFDRISREVRQAKNIDVVNSILATNPGVLQLNSTDSTGASRIVKFIVENGVLNLYQNGTLTGNLTNNNVTVSNLVFRRIATTQSEAVKVEMTISEVSGGSTITEKFYDTIVIRGGY